MEIRSFAATIAAALALSSLGCASTSQLGGLRDEPLSERTLRTTLFHVVAPGDTLSHLSRRYEVSVEKIVRENGLTNPDLLAVGVELAIPLGS